MAWATARECVGLKKWLDKRRLELYFGLGAAGAFRSFCWNDGVGESYANGGFAF